jgi:hypothetical protein
MHQKTVQRACQARRTDQPRLAIRPSPVGAGATIRDYNYPRERATARFVHAKYESYLTSYEPGLPG